MGGGGYCSYLRTLHATMVNFRKSQIEGDKIEYAISLDIEYHP